MLKQQQQTLQAIIDNAPLWIWMCNRDRKVHLVNQTLTQDIGVTKADFLAAEDYTNCWEQRRSPVLNRIRSAGQPMHPCERSKRSCWPMGENTRWK
ncbi:MAG: hypothetical protein HC895_12530 [Leptolyngbyaceae cyanobacterium SM1_3_5]|nr:hypothetical protein [Leptolyngbyaceae cyanobacterium SM1_3_5]